MKIIKKKISVPFIGKRKGQKWQRLWGGLHFLCAVSGNSINNICENETTRAFPPQAVRMKSQDALPVEGSLQKLPETDSSLGRPDWCMDIMKQRQREDWVKAPYISDLNMKSDHAFMNLTWKWGLIRVCERLVWVCTRLDAWISTLKAGLGTDLAGRKKQKSSLLCHFKRLLSYWVFWFLLCLVYFLHSENVPNEWPKS